jgi:ATP adenylyltransferase
MSKLWTPWRLPYILSDKQALGCIFCSARDASDDAGVLVLFRGRRAFVLLNRYPYNNGHVLVAPNQHLDGLAALDAETRSEMAELAAASERILRQAYRPDGLNMGINLGAAAGAGVLGHVHLHAVPRWSGDTNYMATIGDVRVIPERLEESYRRLRPLYADLDPSARD